MDVSSRPPPKRLTLAMIAERLGISTATVSLALRSSPLVADDTRKRVAALADELGYIYNRSAASLRTARTNIVGVVVNDILNSYFAELVAAVETELVEHQLTVLLCNHGDDFARQRNFLETLLQYRADGVILVPSVGTTPKDVTRLETAGLSTVLIAREVPGLDETPMVRGDDGAGLRMAVEHLIGLGHRRIAFVGGRSQSSSGRDRRRGYEEALEAAGIPVDPDLIFTELMTRNEGRAITDAVLARKPTAIAAFNDLIALGIVNELRRRGLEPGRDVSVTGYDDIEEASVWSPALTTVWNGQQEVGRRAAAMLTGILQGRAPEQRRILVTPELRLRESTSAPAA
ncbi:transcriptional regulator [Prosthecomicrobium hirschii]|uniref:Transcriptional regulator n=1 Tax=Prosthecodimorpha hirschii TaxID=665126 RepID=A0A0P6VSM3_9HYPH|nr:LacI family DNA-binding transcriptional regulator [Prosthecomicrobium hirschii]KPL54219.1 transcriptional regulator [Prosthecomicrobium hirschii]